MVDFNLIDTHAHLDMNQFDKDRQEVISRAGDNKMAIVNMAVDLDSSEQGIELARENPSIYVGIGFHPHEASQYNSKAEKRLRQLVSHPKVVAIGEIGLDFYRNHSPRNEPAYVQYVAEKIAEVKSSPLQQVAKQTTTNAEKILGL